MEQGTTRVTVTFELPKEKLRKLDERARSGHRSRNKEVLRSVDHWLAVDDADTSRRTG